MSKDKHSGRLMVDLETLGTSPKGVILSIGAVYRKPGQDDKDFFHNLTIESQLGRRFIDPGPVKFWMGQPGHVGEAALAGAQHIAEVDKLWKEYVKENAPEEVWANGVTFDLAILRDARMAYWGHGREMCLRPIRSLGLDYGLAYGEYKAQWFADHPGEDLHNALSDARLQMDYLDEVYGRMALYKRGELR